MAEKMNKKVPERMTGISKSYVYRTLFSCFFAKLKVIPGFLIALVLSLTQPAIGQPEFRKPPHRIKNALDVKGPYIKTIYKFEPVYYDTLPQQGPDPLLLARYGNKGLVPVIFDAVFNDEIKVYDPNFWGSVPQLIEKTGHVQFDTLDILNYLDAGWDTIIMIDDNGVAEQIPVYREIPYEEIGGIFFFESWGLDQKNHRMYKDVIAYLPIREYIPLFEGNESPEIHRRLLYMVIPAWSSGTYRPVRQRPKDFRLLYSDLLYEVKLYNRSYQLYLYREEEYGQVSQAEFNEWQYHKFDFYRFFDADLFLEKVITAILAGELQAYRPGEPDVPLARDEFLGVLLNYPGNAEEGDLGVATGQVHASTGLLPEDFPLSDLNSVHFHEDWYINPENLQIYKDIRGITVNRSEALVDKYTGEFMRGMLKPIFTVWF
jgi:hypothetical protein